MEETYWLAESLASDPEFGLEHRDSRVRTKAAIAEAARLVAPPKETGDVFAVTDRFVARREALARLAGEEEA